MMVENADSGVMPCDGADALESFVGVPSILNA